MLTRGHLIIIKRDGKDGSVYPVTTTTCSVGRGLQNDIRIHLQSVSQEHCKIYTSDFQQAILKNLSSANPTKVNNVPIGESEHHLEHGDVITTGERSFRWEYLPPSQYHRPTKAKTSPLRGSTGMVGMPISVLQSTLGTQSFNRRSGIVTERKIKLSPALLVSSDQSPAKCDTSFSPSRRLVAIVSPQRRPQSEKKASRASAGNSRAPNQEDEGSSAVPVSGSKVIAQSRRQKSPVAAGPVTNVSSSADKTVAELRNQSSGKRMYSTPSSRKSSRLYSKSARKASESYNNVKIFQNVRSWQSLVTNRKAPLVSSKARKSVGGTPLPKVSRIPTLVKSVSKLSRAKTPESSKASRRSGGNLKKKKKTPVSSVKTKKSEQKGPVAVSAQERKRKCESGLRSAERAAKKLKLESPKTPDKKKMAALLVCHGKVSRPKTPQLVVTSSPQRVADMSKVKHKSRTPTSVPEFHGSAIQKTRRKKSENLRASNDGMTSAKDVFSLEISPNLKFDSDAILLNVSSGQRAENKERPLTSSQKSRRSRTLKSEQTVSPEPGKITDLSGVAELFNSPVKATSTRKRASLISGDTIQIQTALLSEGRHSRDNSVDLHTPNIFELQIGVSSGKKTPKSTARQSLFKSLMKKSIEYKSALIGESMGNAEAPGSLPDISHVGRKSRSVSVGFPVTSEETNQTSSRKSRNLSAKWSSNSESHSPTTRKFSSSPELEQKTRPLTVSGTPVSEQTASRKSSRIGMHSPESVKSTSRSLSKSGSKGTLFSPGTPVSVLSGSIRRSRSSIVTQSPKCDKSDLKLLPGTGKKGKSVSSSMSPYNKTASTMNLMNTVGVGSSPGSIVQNSTSTCFRMSSAGTGKGAISVSGLSVSPKKTNLVKDLSSYLDEESPSSSGSRFKKSSERHVRTSSRSEFSLDFVSPQKSMLLQESDISYERKTRSSQKRIAHSGVNQTQSPAPSSQNTTFDFDSVRTPRIPVENLVSPLSSSRKRKSLRWQDISMILQKQNSDPAIKRQHISERVDGNITILNDSSVHPLSPQQLFSSSLIDEPIHTSRSAGQGWESCDNFSPGVKTCVSSKNASPYVHAIQNIKKMSPAVNLSGCGRIHRFSAGSRISESFGNNMNNISGALQLMKMSSSPKSPVNDFPDVHGGEKLTTVRRTSKSPKDGLMDVHVVEQLTKDPRSPKSRKSELRDVCRARRLTETQGSPKSPQNDLRDVRGVRNLVKTPRSPKSPQNDLRDVHGVRNLMKKPRSPKSPRNDLRDVRGVRQLLKTPRSPKSPKNDLRDVRGVRNLMKTPRSPKFPKNDLRDVRGVRQLLRTPRSPKSPENDLRDVRGVRNLLKTPRSPKSPQNDLRDVRGVRNLMKTPRSPKSPKNDLTDVRGVKRLMTTPQVTRSPKNDITDVHGVKELMETPSPRSGARGLTDIDEPRLEKTPTSPSPRSGSHASLTHSKLKTPERYSVDGKVPSIATRTRHRQASGKTAPIKHSPKFIKTEVPEADRSDAEGSVDQKNISMPEEVKTNNARSRRNRKGPDIGMVKVEIAGGSTTPRSKKRQKENKAQNNEDLSPEKHLEVSVEPTDTSLSSARAQNRVHFDIPNSPDIPVAQVTRKKRGVVDAAVQLQSSPPGTRKMLRSKGSVKGESIAKEDINDPSVSLPPVRKTRGTKLTSAVEVASPPVRSRRGAKVAADAESSPVPSKRWHGLISQSNTEQSSPPPRTRRGGTVTTGSVLSSSPKRQQAVIVTVNGKPLPPRTRRRAIVSTEREIPESPVTKKTRGKLTLKTAVTLPPVATGVPQEDSFTSANKQLTCEASPSPAGKGRKQTKAVEQPATKPVRKLRGTKLSDVLEDETGSSGTKTRSRKPRIISSPVLKAKSPPVISRRGEKRSAKREVSPEAATERRTRASQRRK